MKYYAIMHTDNRVIAVGDFLECSRQAQEECPTPPGHGSDYVLVSEYGYKALFHNGKMEDQAA